MKPAVTLQLGRGGGGFTLIELLLTLVILLVLLGAIVMNFTGLQQGARLEEGAEQLESLVRFARAHAASTGCKVRLTFEEPVEEDLIVPLGNIFASWEPEPLEKPGEFRRLVEVDSLLQSLLGLVLINDVTPLEGAMAADSNPASDLAVDAANSADTGFVSFRPITFYPDGSSDSAEIILSARDSEDDRRMAVRIVGATGAIRREVVRDTSATGQDSSPEVLSQE